MAAFAFGQMTPTHTGDLYSTSWVSPGAIQMEVGIKANFCILHNSARRQSHRVCANTQVQTRKYTSSKKRGKKAAMPGRKPIPTTLYLSMCRAAAGQEPPDWRCQGYIWLQRLLGATSPKMLPPIFPSQVDPLWEQTLHLARCATHGFFLCV